MLRLVAQRLRRGVFSGRCSPDDSSSQSSKFFFGLGADTGRIGGKRGESCRRLRVRFGNDRGMTRGRGR